MQWWWKHSLGCLLGLLLVASVAKAQDYLGEWVVKRHVASGPVSIYSEADVKKLIGKTVTYSGEKARFDTTVCANPVYKETVISANDYLADNRVSLKALGIAAQQIVRVTVYEGAKPWKGPGSVILIKSPDIVILSTGGVYLELARTPK